MPWVDLQVEPGVHRIVQGEADQVPGVAFPHLDGAPGVVGVQGVPDAPDDVAYVQVAGAMSLPSSTH
jgi:hypothetical protein